jgi:hypothetical protein
MRSPSLLCLLALSCAGDDPQTPTTPVPQPVPEPEPTLPAEPWCEVSDLFDRGCISCHMPSHLLGELDLDTDPEAATVGVVSETYGEVIVAPGDPGGSLLFRKMAGTQAEDEGGIMPPTGVWNEELLGKVRYWIEVGAPFVCTATAL